MAAEYEVIDDRSNCTIFFLASYLAAHAHAVPVREYFTGAYATARCLSANDDDKAPSKLTVR